MSDQENTEPKKETIKEKYSPKSAVYGPVASWRLGRSLGIDLLCSEQKICNFDCVYCQLGPTTKLQTGRKEFVSLSKLQNDLNAVKGVAADWVTFSGMGEPTLASNLGAAISLVKSTLGLPVAVFTNGSLIVYKDIRKELALADMVIAKLDAPEEDIFRAINRPSEEVRFSRIMMGWQLFRMEYKGKLAMNIMLSDLNKGAIYELHLKAKLLMPDQVQLNTPMRPCSVKPLHRAEFDTCKQWFWNFKEVVNVYESKVTEVEPLDAKETELRHPRKTKE